MLVPISGLSAYFTLISELHTPYKISPPDHSQIYRYFTQRLEFLAIMPKFTTLAKIHFDRHIYEKYADTRL